MAQLCRRLVASPWLVLTFFFVCVPCPQACATCCTSRSCSAACPPVPCRPCWPSSRACTAPSRSAAPPWTCSCCCTRASTCWPRPRTTSSHPPQGPSPCRTVRAILQYLPKLSGYQNPHGHAFTLLGDVAILIFHECSVFHAAAWVSSWGCTLEALATAARDPRLGVRCHALSLLTEALLDKQSTYIDSINRVDCMALIWLLGWQASVWVRRTSAASLLRWRSLWPSLPTPPRQRPQSLTTQVGAISKHHECLDVWWTDVISSWLYESGSF